MRAKRLFISGAGVVAALAATAPSANAAIAGGNPLVTETRPNLVSVSIREQDNVQPKRVYFCFDESIRPNSIVDTGFQLIGYDVDEIEESNNAVIEPANDNCIIAEFDNNTVLAEYSVATVDQGAVRNVSHNKENIRDAVPFSDSTGLIGGGLTTAPDLVSATVDEAFNQIVLVFDRRIEPGSVNLNDIYYYEAGGVRVQADGATLDNSTRTILRVHFPQGGGDQTVADAQRVALEDGAVVAEDALSEESVRQSINVEGKNGRTARPELVSAVIANAAGNAVDFTFDQTIETEDASDFEVFRDEESRFQGSTFTVLESQGSLNGRVVRVWFNTPSDQEFAEISVASVDNGAVDSGDPANLENSIGSVRIGNSRGAKGFTSAPDATDVEFNEVDGTATVTFDQDVQDVDLARFRVVDNDGNETAAQPSDLISVDGNQVTFIVDQDVLNNAQGVSLQQDAVETDGNGSDESVQQSIGRDNPVPSAGPDDLPVGGGGGGTPAPQPGPAPAPAPAQQVAAAGGAAPTARVSPARSGKSAKARVLYAKYRKGSLTTKISSKAKKVKIRITLRNKKGKTVKTVTRTVRTNRQVTLKNLTRSSAVKSVKVRVL